jgi:hypothetical protein
MNIAWCRVADMDGRIPPSANPRESADQKTPWETPELKRLGDFVTLTRGGQRVGADAPGHSKNP